LKSRTIFSPLGHSLHFIVASVLDRSPVDAD